MILKQNQHGTVTLDHRNSPGITAADVERLRLLGHNVPLAPEGSYLEFKTKACGRCGTVVFLNPDRVRERGHCYRCDKYLCDPCEATQECRNGTCLPIQARADIVVGSDKPLPLIYRS